MTKEINRIDDRLKTLLLEWKFLGMSKELLLEKIKKMYEEGEHNEIRSKKC